MSDFACMCGKAYCLSLILMASNIIKELSKGSFVMQNGNFNNKLAEVS